MQISEVYDWTLSENQTSLIFRGGWDARQKQESTYYEASNHMWGSIDIVEAIVKTIEGAHLAMASHVDENMNGCDPSSFNAYSQWKKSPAWQNKASAILSILGQTMLKDIILLILEYCCNDGFVMTTTVMGVSDNFRIVMGRGRFELIRFYHIGIHCEYTLFDHWRTSRQLCIMSLRTDMNARVNVCSLDIDVLLIGDIGTSRKYIIDSRGSHIRIYSTDVHFGVRVSRITYNSHNQEDRYIVVSHELHIDRRSDEIPKEYHRRFRISDNIKDARMIATGIY
jgi:hypothetical protein